MGEAKARLGDGALTMNLFGFSISRRVTTKQVIAATVRPQDAALAVSSATPMTMQEACNRYSKWVKVAVSRNATGLASCPLRVMRATKEVERSAFKTRRVDSARLAWLHSTGGLASRAIDEYGDAEEIVDPQHPLVALLRKANPFDSGFGLVEMTETYLALAGNAYWVKVKGEQGVAELWQLPPAYVRVIPSKAGLVEGYVYGRGREIEQRWSAEDVIQFKRPNPHGSRLTPWPYYGLGDLAACVDDADMSTLMTRFGLAMLLNGGQPGMIAKPPKGEFLTPEQARAIEAELNRRYGGVEKAGKAAVITGHVEIEKMSLGEKEVAFLSSQTASMEAIANCFDMPVSLMRLDTAGAVATTTSAITVWQRMSLRPKAKRIEDTINERLVPDFGESAGNGALFVCFDNIVDKDFAVDSVAASTLYAGELLTKNEARAIVGFDAVDGGDDFKERPEPLLGGFGQQGAKDGEEGEGKEDQEPPEDAERTTRIYRGVRADAVHNHAGLFRCSDLAWGVCCDHERFVFATGRDDGGIRGYSEVLNPMDAEQEVSAARLYAAVRRWFAEHVKGKADYAGGELVVNTATIRKAFEELTGPELARLFDFGVRTGQADVNKVPKLAEFVVPNVEAEKFLKAYKFKLADAVAASTERRMRGIVLDGVQGGKSIGEITKDLYESVDDMEKYAAERIARTETGRAFQEGTLTAWKSTGLRVRKRWSLSADPCALCEAMAERFGGDGIDIGLPFLTNGGSITGTDGREYFNDYMDMNTATPHPNCVLAGTPVSARGVVAAFTAWYDGDAIVLTMASGRTLSVTPNHMLLTTSGFVAANSIREGDDVVDGSFVERIVPGHPHDYQVPTAIEDVVRAFAESSGVSAAGVPVAAEHFHGDGVSIQGHVHVVASNGLLRRGRVATDAQEIHDKPLYWGWHDSEFARLGDEDAVLIGLSLEAHVKPTMSRHSLSVRVGQMFNHLSVRLDSVPWLNACLAHASGHHGPADAKRFCYVFDGLARVVPADKVVHADRRKYLGHVYDLQTVSGLYSVNGVVTSNCRCAIVCEVVE